MRTFLYNGVTTRFQMRTFLSSGVTTRFEMRTFVFNGTLPLSLLALAEVTLPDTCGREVLRAITTLFRHDWRSGSLTQARLFMACHKLLQAKPNYVSFQIYNYRRKGNNVSVMLYLYSVGAWFEFQQQSCHLTWSPKLRLIKYLQRHGRNM